MALVWTLFLSLIQGLTEFLPISSSGHLVFIQQLFELKEADLLLNTALHMGTCLAIIIFFRRELIKIKLRQVMLLFTASLPALFFVFLFYSLLSSLFLNPKILPVTFFISAVFLFTLKKENKIIGQKEINDISFSDAFFIGLFQALAILPGISRSGSTFCAGLWRGLKKETAFYFSFLMAIPAIIAAFALELWQNQTTYTQPDFVIALLASFTASLFGLFLFKKLLKVQKIYLFSYYLLTLSIISFFIFIISR